MHVCSAAAYRRLILSDRMEINEIEKLEEAQRIITGIVMNALAEKQRELQESNKELSERNGILELQIKAKEATLRDIDAAAKAMFAPPEQPVATDMAGFEGDEV